MPGVCHAFFFHKFGDEGKNDLKCAKADQCSVVEIFQDIKTAFSNRRPGAAGDTSVEESGNVTAGPSPHQDRTPMLSEEESQKHAFGPVQCALNYVTLTKSEFKNALETISKRPQKSDFLFLYILSHTKDHKLMTKKDGEQDNTIDVWEVLDYFKDEKCEEFRGKPKIVIIQSCAGTAVMPDCRTTQEPRKVCSVRENVWSFEQEVCERLRRKERHFFIVYASPPGYKAHSDTEGGNGSDFTNALKEVIHQNVKSRIKVKITELMYQVNMHLVKMFQNEQEPNKNTKGFPSISFVVNQLTENFTIG